MRMWSGWIWDTRRQRWERVCEVEGIAACSRRLGEIAAIRNVKNNMYLVVTGGGAPDRRPPKRNEIGLQPLRKNPSEKLTEE